MSALERFMSGGNIYSGASPILRQFLQPQRPTVDIASLSRARELELAGAGDAQIERAKLFERTRGETGVIPTRSLIEGTVGPDGDFLGGEDTQPRGFLEAAGDVIQRGVSASVGGFSGLLGLERRRESVGDGALFGRSEGAQQGESNSGMALRRFAEGLSGEEMYRFADFGVLAYDRETTALPERAMKATAGFLLDTLVDPITYMSLGGSIFGRARGAQRVFAWMNNKSREAIEQSLKQAPIEKRLDIIARASETHAVSPAVIRNRMRDELEGILELSTGRRRAQIMRQLDELDTKFMDPEFLNDTLRMAPNFSANLASDIVAANGALAYRTGSSIGLKNYLRDELGDNGMTLFRSLPLDMQGGIRMRVPFSAIGGRDPKLLFRIPGTDKLSGLSNGTRQFLRNNAPAVRNLAAKANGRFGDIDMQLASAAYASKRNAATKVFGAVDPDTRAVFWYDNETFKSLARQSDMVFNRVVREMVNDWQVGREHLKDGVQLFARQNGVPEDEARKSFIQTVDQAMLRTVREPDGTIRPESLTEAFGANPSPIEMEAYGAASMFSSVTNRIAREMEELFPDDSVRPFRRLEEDGEYATRMLDYMNEVLGKGQSGGSATGQTFARKSFFAVRDMDGNIVQSMSPLQIAARLGGDADNALFVTDPADAMLAYMVAASRIISEERLFQNMQSIGLIVRGQENLVGNIDAAIDAAIGGAREIGNRQAQLAGIARGEGGRRDPQAIIDAMSGWKRHGRLTLEKYNQTTLQTSETIGNVKVTEVYRSLDNSRVVSLAQGEGIDPRGSWLAQNNQGRFLTADNKFTGDVNKAARFRTRQQAETILSAQPRILQDRTRIYRRYSERLQEEFEQDTVRAIADFETLDPLGTGAPILIRGAREGEWVPNPLHHSNIPIGPEADRYISQLAEWMNKHGMEVVPEQFRSPNLLGQRYRVGTEGQKIYRELSDNTAGVMIKSSMQQRFQREGLFAPSVLVEPIRRMYRVTQKPEGFKKFVDEYYRPFYSVQKALMTAQRGPGYVIRNIQGGMWNAWLFGVGAREFSTSAKVNVAKIRALSDAEKRANDLKTALGWDEIVTEREKTRFAMEAFQERLTETFGNRRGKELFRAWETFTEQALDGRTIASKTIGTRAVTRVGEPDVQLRLAAGENLGFYENAADYLSSRSRWAQLTGGMASESEDYLRFAAYLKGAREFGLEDGGLAAGLYVKASQFDYADLSDFEIDTLKMIIPFYTWARNNIPLQARAIMSEPGRISQALRINDAFRDMFGEEDDPEHPMPAYVRERMGWRVRTDLVQGPFGDALAAGVVIGEPLVDVNRLFRFPSGDRRGGINLRDVANQMNPMFKNGVELLTAMEQSTGGRLPRREEAPGWLRPFVAPFADEGEEPDVNARALRFVRNTIPPIGIAERLFPQALGNERMQRRWYTSLASSILGLPMSTLDPFQTASELRAEESRQRSILESKFGEDYTQYTDFGRALLRRGVTPQEMQALKTVMFDGRELTDVKVDELDHYAARDWVDFERRLKVLAASGVDQERLDRMVERFTPRTDVGMGVRQGRPQPIPQEVLESYGLTQQQVEQMTRERRQQLIDEYFN